MNGIKNVISNKLTVIAAIYVFDIAHLIDTILMLNIVNTINASNTFIIPRNCNMLNLVNILNISTSATYWGCWI